MFLTSWLNPFRTRLSRSVYRQSRRTTRRLTPQQTTESLETRTLLTTTGVLIGTELTVLADGGDDLVVQRDATTGNVQVLANGSVVTSIPPIQSTTLTALNVFTDSGDNDINLSQLTTAEFSSLGSIVVDAGDGDDMITGSNDFAEMIDGGDGNDTIIGGGGNDTLDGGDGDDSIIAGAGMDSIIGGDGQDTIDGGADNDNIDAGDGNDSVDGGDGDDVINSGDGNDTVNGGAGADSINGMSGIDVLNGGVDNDTIFGGSENDIISGDDGDDFLNGQSGNDVINGGAGNDFAYGGGGHDSINGGDDNDTLNGQGGHDTINAGAGNDYGYGGSGDDSLDGGAGRDTLRGHSGNDTLNGGGDSDNLDGGSGNDLVQSGDAQAGTTLPQLSISDVTVVEGSVPYATLLGAPIATPLSDPINGSSVVVSADFDRDGNLDLATEDGVVFNDGTGTFGAIVPITPFDDQPPSVVDVFAIDVADFNLDGTTDLVVTLNNSISVFLSNGDRTFSSPLVISAPFRMSAIRATDLDGNGLPDIAVVSSTAGAISSNIYVFFNQGGATFGPAVAFDTGSERIFDIEALDFNGDGLIDLATVNIGVIGEVDSVILLQGIGSGSFAAPTQISIPAPTALRALAIGDLNVDGIPDIAVADVLGVVHILINNGSGGFTSLPPLTINTNVNGIAMADVDLDGDNDVLTTVFGLPLRLFVNNGDGTFGTGIDFPLGGTNGLAVADVNGDLFPDVALPLSPASFPGTTTAIRFNSGYTQQVAVLTVSLASTSNVPVTVQYATANSLATAGPDYPVSTGTLTFAPGQTSRQIQIPITSDIIAEPDENFVVNLSNPVNAVIGDSQGHVTIVDDDGGTPGPTLNIDSVSLVEGNSGTTTAAFTVSLTSAPTGTVTIDFAVQDLTATSGVDFNVTTVGPLTFSPTILSQTISVDVFGDLTNEGDETFLVHLLNPVGVVLGTTQGIFTITGDDGAFPVPIADDTLLGGSGNDTIVGSIGNDSIDGGSGSDSISGAGGNDSINGGDGSDTIDSGSGDDTVAGWSGNDLISTGSGNDTILWNGLGNGVETVLDSTGVQTLIVQGDSGVNNFTVGSNSGRLQVSEGVASITVSRSTTTVNVLGGSEDDVITVSSLVGVNPLVLNIDGQGDDDTISAFDASIGSVRLFLNGGDGNDTITGSRDADSIRGDGGDDSLIGGLGNDRMDGGDGGDTLHGEAGNDTLLGGLGNDVASGGNGNDSLVGSFGDDTLLGDDGDDSLSGGFGDDVLNGNAGNDLADGGADSDQVLGGSGDDSLDGGTGADTVRGHSGSDLIKGGDGDDRIFGDSGNDIIDAGDGDDWVDAGNGDDIVTGNDGDDTLNGMSGSDTLLGGDGADIQLGGAGIDSLYGEEGDDTLNGGGSIDQFNGGEGADVLASPDAGEFDDNSLAIETSVLEALATLNGF